MLWFLLGCMLGGFFGVFIMCLMTASSHAQRHEETE